MADEAMRIMCVAAHPDDIEFGCAGAVAVWRDEGHDVSFVIVTDGSTGTEDPDLAGEPLARIRREETLAAARVLGVDRVEFLGYRDGYVEATLGLRRDIARQFRTFRPHRMMAMDVAPVIGESFVNHPDHRAVGQATLDITVTAGTTVGHFPELAADGLVPWRGLREIYVMGPADDAHPVDITAGIDRKIAALLCHVSQVGEWDVASAIREWTSQVGSRHGMQYAETFRVIRILNEG